jgi:hypothetical protein
MQKASDVNEAVDRGVKAKMPRCRPCTDAMAGALILTVQLVVGVQNRGPTTEQDDGMKIFMKYFPSRFNSGTDSKARALRPQSLESRLAPAIRRKVSTSI